MSSERCSFQVKSIPVHLLYPSGALREGGQHFTDLSVPIFIGTSTRNTAVSSNLKVKRRDAPVGASRASGNGISIKYFLKLFTYEAHT